MQQLKDLDMGGHQTVCWSSCSISCILPALRILTRLCGPFLVPPKQANKHKPKQTKKNISKYMQRFPACLSGPLLLCSLTGHCKLSTFPMILSPGHLPAVCCHRRGETHAALPCTHTGSGVSSVLLGFFLTLLNVFSASVASNQGGFLPPACAP